MVHRNFKDLEVHEDYKWLFDMLCSSWPLNSSSLDISVKDLKGPVKSSVPSKQILNFVSWKENQNLDLFSERGLAAWVSFVLEIIIYAFDYDSTENKISKSKLVRVCRTSSKIRNNGMDKLNQSILLKEKYYQWVKQNLCLHKRVKCIDTMDRKSNNGNMKQLHYKSIATGYGQLVPQETMITKSGN